MKCRDYIKKYRRNAVRSILGSCLYLFGTVTLNAAIIDIGISLTVFENTCDIYGSRGVNQPITVDFGDLIVSNIDGIKYERPIPYILSCSNPNSQTLLRMSFIGETAEFNSELLGTNNKNLGILLKSNDESLRLRQSVYFLANSQNPRLSIVPIVGGSAPFEGGEFTSSVILQINYL